VVLAQPGDHISRLVGPALKQIRADTRQEPGNHRGVAVRQTPLAPWRKARTAVGYDAVKLHDLRHLYASGLIAAGCDVVTVQRALGHASATVTLGTYAHLWPTAEDRTRAAAAAMLAEALDAHSAHSARNSGQA
jgi:integrase